jgi:predicted permease
MQAILAVTLPFFALVALGWLAGRSRLLPEAAIPGLNAFVLYFALPCMLFRFGLNTPLAQLLNPWVAGVYVLIALVLGAFTVAISLQGELRLGGTTHPPIGLRDAAFGALVAVFPNTGFMGVPMLSALLGAGAVGTIVCTMVVDMVVTTSLAIGVAESGSGRDGARAAMKRALRGAAANPQPWAITAGALCGLLGWRPSGPVDTIVKLLADAATPVALFTIGAVLWRAGQHAHTRTPARRFLPPALVKLLLHPLLVLLLASGARQLGAPLSSFQVMVMTLAAALPSAANVSLLAERFGADNGRVARIILASTATAFVSFTLLAAWFGVNPAR